MNATRAIDLRSDTVTPPPVPRCAGRWPRPRSATTSSATTRRSSRLQERAAELLGKEAALYVPSGTMTNQVALHAQTRRGDEVFLHAQAHIVFYEQGGAAVLSSCSCADLRLRRRDARPRGDGGVRPPRRRRALRADARSSALEDTHNHCGGRRLPAREGPRGARLLRPARPAAAPRRGPHLERGRGRRRVAVRDRVALRHGERVPVEGSRRAGRLAARSATRAFVQRALRARKLFGGGMRQAGIIAAAGLYALEHHVERVVDDHRRARALAERLAPAPGLAVDLEKVQTNMVYAGTRGTGLPAARGRAAALRGGACWPSTRAPWQVRFVTHLDVDDADIEEAAVVVARVLEGAARRADARASAPRPGDARPTREGRGRPHGAPRPSPFAALRLRPRSAARDRPTSSPPASSP